MKVLILLQCTGNAENPTGLSVTFSRHGGILPETGKEIAKEPTKFMNQCYVVFPPQRIVLAALK